MTKRSSWAQKTAAGAVAAAMCLLAAPVRAQTGAADLYKTKCAVCHGSDGHGDTAAGKKIGVRDFASPEVQKESDDELVVIVAKGKNKMPSYEKSLKPEEIKDLVTQIRALAKQK